jgi:hypothetical protein
LRARNPRHPASGATYRRTNHDNIHVRGYKEKGNINTPMELAIQNQVDRFTLAMDAIDRVTSLQVRGAHARDALMNQQLDCRHYAYAGASIPPGSRDGSGPLTRNAAGNRIAAHVIKTDENLMVARCARAVIDEGEQW